MSILFRAPRASLKVVLRTSGVALGWTTLALTGLIEPMVGRGKHLALYHWDGSASAMFGPVLLIFGLVCSATFGLLLAAKNPGRWRVAVWGGGLLSIPWLLANAGEHLLRPVPWLRAWLFAFGIVALVVLLARWRIQFESRFERVLARYATAMLAVGFSGVLVLVQIIWFWWAARDLNEARPSVASTKLSTAGTQPRARVIWVVFDELSYSQVYERRFPGVRLPAFDELAGQATVFTHVIPAGSKTDVVLPSLITGKPVLGIRASAAGLLDTLANEQAKWQEFAQHDSVFQDALDAGYSTGVAGWYNPYCRILPAVLDRCYWRMYTELDNGLTSSASFGTNLKLALHGILSGEGPATASGNAEPLLPGRDAASKGHLEDYRNLLRQADRLLENSSANFVLLHMPVPHPHGIFNRHTGEFAIEHTSYLDNLVLADRCLAEMRTELERSGAWDATTLVLMGDHSWRVDSMWRKNPQRWTAEEEIASEGGHFDDRPGYVVKLPHERAGMRIDTPFAAVNTRQLLDQLMNDRLQSPEQLAAWVKQEQAQ